MKRIITAILSLIIAFSLTACQPTPQKAVVAEKDSENLIGEAQKDDTTKGNGISLSQQYSIPKNYQFEMQSANGLLNIKVDAQVVTPDSDRMPIYRVKATEFSQEMVSTFFEALCGETEMWIESEQQTKNQIQEQILMLKKLISENNEQFLADIGGIEEAKKRLAELEKEFEISPESNVEKRTYGELIPMSTTSIDTSTTNTSAAGEGGVDVEPAVTPSPSSTYSGLKAYEKSNVGLNGKGRIYHVANNSTPNMLYLDYRNSAAYINFGSFASFPVLNDADITEEALSIVGLKPSEARQKIQDLLDRTGSNMVVDSVYLQNDEQNGNYGEAARPAEQYAYKVFCVRTVDGVSSSYVGGGSKPDVNDTMAPYWHYESLDIMINSEGIIKLEWLAPIEVVETVNEDAQLKPFSEIREIFENMMGIKYEPQAELSGDKYNFEINRVTLSLHRIVEKNSNESGLMVPAWNFYGKLNVTPSSGSSTGIVEYLGESYMTINAIDGSIIDTSKGY